jgi:hypothetical protein
VALGRICCEALGILHATAETLQLVLNFVERLINTKNVSIQISDMSSHTLQLTRLLIELGRNLLLVLSQASEKIIVRIRVFLIEGLDGETWRSKVAVARTNAEVAREGREVERGGERRRCKAIPEIIGLQEAHHVIVGIIPVSKESTSHSPICLMPREHRSSNLVVHQGIPAAIRKVSSGAPRAPTGRSTYTTTNGGGAPTKDTSGSTEK